MVQKTSNVAAGSPVATGGILTGPLGTPLPTDEITALNAAIKALGYVADSGVESSGDAPSITDIKAWGGDTVASLREDSGTTKYTFSLLEIFSVETAKLVFGDANVTSTAATTSAGAKLAIQDKGAPASRRVFVFDMAYGGKKMRVVVPNGQLVVTGERPFVDNDLAGYECELTCLPDDNGTRSYRYYANDDKVPA